MKTGLWLSKCSPPLVGLRRRLRRPYFTARLRLRRWKRHCAVDLNSVRWSADGHLRLYPAEYDGAAARGRADVACPALGEGGEQRHGGVYSRCTSALYRSRRDAERDDGGGESPIRDRIGKAAGRPRRAEYASGGAKD